jgi:hypothetical protein
VSFVLRRQLRILAAAFFVLAALILYLKTYPFDEDLEVVKEKSVVKSVATRSASMNRERENVKAKDSQALSRASEKGWAELLRRYPKLVVEKKEEVHFSDGSKETWALFRTSPSNPKLWILQETEDGLQAAVAGEILLQVKGDAEYREFRDQADELDLELEIENDRLGLYRIQFDPEDMALYRRMLSDFQDSAPRSGAVQRNLMVGIEP